MSYAMQAPVIFGCVANTGVVGAIFVSVANSGFSGGRFRPKPGETRNWLGSVTNAGLRAEIRAAAGSELGREGEEVQAKSGERRLVRQFTRQDSMAVLICQV